MATGFMAGSVIAKLVLDKTKWSQGVASVKKDEKTLGGMSDRTARKFRGVGTAMTAAGGLIIGSFGAMIAKYVQAGDEIDKMSRRTGIAATTLSELKYAADITGASFTDVEKGVKRMAKTISDAGDGMATYVRAFDRLGISVTDLQKLNPEQQFFSIGEAIASLEDPSLRAATAQDIFGRAGTKLLPLFAEGEKGLAALRDEAHKLGIIFDQEAALKAAKLKDAQTALKGSVQGLGFALADGLIPAMTKAVKGITEFVSKITAWAKAHPGLFSAITKIVGVLGGLLTVLGPLVILLPSMVNGVKLLGVAFKGALGPIGLVTTAIVAAGAALNSWINARKKAMDQEMDAMRQDKTLAEMHDLRRKAIEKGIMTQQEWATEVNKFGKDYKAFLKAVATAPEYEQLRGELEDIRGAQEDTGDSTSDLETDYSSLLSQVQGTNEEVKTWVDFLKDNAIQTIQDKADAIEELEGYLDDLEQAYKDGKLTAEDYEKAQGLIHDKLVELGGASKTYYDHLKDIGIPTMEDVEEQIGTVETQLDALNTAYDNGEVSTKHYRDGIEQLEGKLENLTDDFIIVDGKLQELGVHFDAFVPKARDLGGALDDMLPGALKDTKEMKTETFSTTKEVKSKWSEVADGVRSKWTTELGEMLRGTTSFKDAVKSVWDSMVVQFTDIIAQMVTKWIFGFIDRLITSATDAGSKVAGALSKALGGDATDSVAGSLGKVSGSMGSLLNVASGAANIVSAVANVISLFKQAGPSSTDSWHFQETWKNTKEIRDWHFINHQERLNNLEKFAGERNSKLDRIGNYLHTVQKPRLRTALESLRAIAKNINKLAPKKAQTGYVSMANEIIETHGTPQRPEYIIPHTDLSRLLRAPKETAAQPINNIDFTMPVNLNGMIITDRDFTRGRFMQEFLAALEANVGKTRLKQILGIP